jgi:hypothetical protein
VITPPATARSHFSRGRWDLTTGVIFRQWPSPYGRIVEFLAVSDRMLSRGCPVRASGRQISERIGRVGTSLMAGGWHRIQATNC